MSSVERRLSKLEAGLGQAPDTCPACASRPVTIHHHRVVDGREWYEPPLPGPSPVCQDKVGAPLPDGARRVALLIINCVGRDGVLLDAGPPGPLDRFEE